MDGLADTAFSRVGAGVALRAPGRLSCLNIFSNKDANHDAGRPNGSLNRPCGLSLSRQGCRVATGSLSGRQQTEQRSGRFITHVSIPWCEPNRLILRCLTGYTGAPDGAWGYLAPDLLLCCMQGVGQGLGLITDHDAAPAPLPTLYHQRY